MTNRLQRMVMVALPLCVAGALIFTLAVAEDQPATANAGGQVPQMGQMPPPANDSIFTVIKGGYQSVKSAFVHSCYDCHSDQTHFPWYYKLPLVKGMIDSDIKGGRKQVDFSKDFPFTGRGSQADMLSHIRDEIADGGMPLFKYRIIHWGRQIEPPLQDTVFAWIDSSLARLATVGIVPAESRDKGDGD